MSVGVVVSSTVRWERAAEAPRVVDGSLAWKPESYSQQELQREVTLPILGRDWPLPVVVLFLRPLKYPAHAVILPPENDTTYSAHESFPSPDTVGGGCN